jgi:hypothetical protein
MSGSGGGAGYNSGETKDCQLLSFRTQLASPKLAVIAKLMINELLDVNLTPPSGPVQVTNSEGEIAGAILSPDIATLIQCIAEGHEYQAKVIDIKGGNCQILITHK